MSEDSMHKDHTKGKVRDDMMVAFAKALCQNPNVTLSTSASDIKDAAFALAEEVMGKAKQEKDK